MRPTILQRTAVIAAAVFTIGTRPAAQTPAARADPFAAQRWHFEAALHGVWETWNYNVSHEELYGLTEGVTYGLKDGLVLTLQQRVYYVSQRANDSWLLGLTAGARHRVYRRGRASLFLEGAAGISDAAIAAPPRGTRFNYLATASGGIVFTLRRRLHVVGDLQLLHISNNSLKGPGRNPDIEALGPRVGVLVGF